MNCPKCPDSRLRSVSAAAPLAEMASVPQRCLRCGGLWVARQAVPALHESGILQAIEGDAEAGGEADKRNGLCPEGHGILARARVSWEQPYFVERCNSCDGLWLDAGEWSRLSSDLLLDDLDELWLPSWRRRLHDQHAQKRLEADLTDKLGPELFAQTKQFGMLLAEHKHGDAALAYLRELVRRHRSRLPEG